MLSVSTYKLRINYATLYDFSDYIVRLLECFVRSYLNKRIIKKYYINK